ncbi:hypothetical protein JOF53_007635 [Crossiella equi]|uniref:Uncharacterized protein n=1 Tax=Crossiella equi TaxID=130796 RepID=A0ABS5AQB9_9PSEU|nr:hypothetical protein [Crossiella equi]
MTWLPHAVRRSVPASDGYTGASAGTSAVTVVASVVKSGRTGREAAVAARQPVRSAHASSSAATLDETGTG